jgi:hypothetical protein
VRSGWGAYRPEVPISAGSKVLVSCRPEKEVGFQLLLDRIAQVFPIVVSRFLELQEDAPSHAWQRCRQWAGYYGRKRIEVAATESTELVPTGKGAVQKLNNVTLGEAAYVRGIVFEWTGLSADRQQNAVVECGEVGHTDQKVPALSQGPADLIKNPKNFFGVLQDLVRHNDIQLSRFKRKGITLDVKGMNGDPFALQLCHVRRVGFDPDQLGVGIHRSGDQEIVAMARTDVQDLFEGTGIAKVALDQMPTVI